MAKYEFVATHGVHFSDGGDAWAHFERMRDLDTPEGEKRYTFATDDAEVAARVRKVSDYGITEVSKSQSGSVEPKRSTGRPRKAA